MKILLTLFSILITCSIYSQVKVGDNPNAINSNSILELESTDKVLVVTRLTTTQINALTPLNGAIVYDIDRGCLFQYNNNTWNSLCAGVMAQETVTSIIDNNDGTFTYTDEDGGTTIVDVTNLETTTIITNNNDGTYTYTNEDTSNQTINTNADTNPYDNASSGLTATNVQTAIDELNTNSTDNQVISSNNAPGNISIEDGNTLTLNVNDADASITNEVNTAFAVVGTDLQITDSDGTLAVPLAAIGSDDQAISSAVNTANVSVDVTLEDGGNTTINIQDADSSATNELITSGTLNGTDLEIVDSGGTTTVDLSSLNNSGTDDQAISSAVNTANVSVDVTLEDGGNTTINIQDADSSATNEIQDISSNNSPGNISISSGSTLNINVNDADADATNEIQNVTSADNSVTISQTGDDFDLSIPVNNDNDPINEFQNLSSIVTTTNETVEIQITDGTNTSIDIRDADSDITNELQDLSLSGTELTLTTPATPANSVDLTGAITLPMLANGVNTNDEIIWDGTQWVSMTSVRTVNLANPDSDGNINIPIGNVYTGPTTNTGDIGPIEIGGIPEEGDIYVINSDATIPTDVGRTYIYDANTTTWIEIDPFNAALYDPRYVNVTGDTMVGNLDMNGNTVTDLGAPVNATDATPKSYVDNISLTDNLDGTFTLSKPDGSSDTINKPLWTASP